MSEKLKRSNTNKVIGGVCGGLGEYFDVDPVFVRIVAVVLAFATGFGLIAYIVAWIIMPKQEFDEMPEAVVNGEPVKPLTPGNSSWKRYWPGMILISFGVILLVREYGYWFDWSEFWPVALILLGLVLVFRKTQGNKNGEPVQPTSEVHGNGQRSSENGGTG